MSERFGSITRSIINACKYHLQVITEVTDVNCEQVQYAIDAASESFQTWKKLASKERSVLMRNLFENIIRHKEELAHIMTSESGKPIQGVRAEVHYGASYFEWFAEEAKRMYGDILPGCDGTNRRFVFKQPIGVVAMVTPWNFPFAMIARKLSAAMAAGCTAVIKPSADTPLTALALAAIAKDSGIPDGVINVLPCSTGKFHYYLTAWLKDLQNI